MNSAVDIQRLQFAFTITFHHIFPQLTMGLALGRSSIWQTAHGFLVGAASERPEKLIMRVCTD